MILITLSPGGWWSVDPQNNHTLNPFPRKQTFVSLSSDWSKRTFGVKCMFDRGGDHDHRLAGEEVILFVENRWRILNPLNTLMVARCCPMLACYAIICRGPCGILRQLEPLKGIYSCFLSVGWVWRPSEPSPQLWKSVLIFYMLQPLKLKPYEMVPYRPYTDRVTQKDKQRIKVKQYSLKKNDSNDFILAWESHIFPLHQGTQGSIDS